jgi:hypothetical protein
MRILCIYDSGTQLNVKSNSTAAAKLNKPNQPNLSVNGLRPVEPLMLQIGQRPDEPYFYQSAYGLTNLIFTNRSTACKTLFLPIPGYYLT